MKAILLGAGLGTRLRPLTEHLPKVLMPIRGVPLLAYWLCALKRSAVGPARVNVHHHAVLVENFLHRHAAAFDVMPVHEPALLNTGGTVLANADFLGDEPFVLIHADNLCLCPLDAFIDAHARRPAGAVMTMMTFRAPDPRACGIVELDAQGLVQGFHEKVAEPPGDLANAALYVIEPSVLRFLQDLGKTVIDFSYEVIPAFLGRIHTYHNDVYHRDIGTLAALEAAQHDDHADPPEIATYQLVDTSLPLAEQVGVLAGLLRS